MTLQRLILLLLAAWPLVAGCRASYPTGSVEDTIAKICQDEYHVEVQVAKAGKTIGALIVMPDILLSDLTFSDQALNKIENVMLTTSRVTLSSQFNYDFFVITIMDAKTGIRVSFTRYIKDIRRLIMDDISRSDYFQRLLIEVESGRPVSDPAAARFDLKDQVLEDFLARQIAERIRLQFQVNLVVERLFKINGIEGVFLPAADDADRYAAPGRFQLRLSFKPQAPPFATVASPTLRENLYQLLFETAKQVIRRYEFKNFEGLAIVGPSDEALAYYESEEFSKGSMNTLMELIRSLKQKGK